MTALLFLARYWRVVVIVSLVLALGAQTFRLHHAKADLTTARAALVNPVTHKTWQSEAIAAQRDLTTCRGNTDRLSTALQTQNASIDALKREADAINTVAGAKIRAAQADTVKARRDVAAIMAKRPGSDLCASALELMREP